MEEMINEKLSRLRQYVGYLRALKDTSLEAFEKDFRVRGAIERYLHLAIESVIDIGNEIISALQLRRPEQYRDIPYILVEALVIPERFAEDVARMIGFRNLIVYDYAALDRELEFGFLQSRLGDFDVYMKHVAEWLKNRALANP